MFELPMNPFVLPKPIIPELIQDDATPANIADEVARYFENRALVADLESQFDKMHSDLKLDANYQAGRAVLRMLGKDP